MFRLERITLHCWGRLVAEDVEIRGATALLVPTGAGKSTVIDALQVLLTGANSHYYSLNKSTGGSNERSIKDYCLGVDSQLADDLVRTSADTLVALAFGDGERAVSIGLMFSADETSPATLRPTTMFVARDHSFRLSDHFRPGADGRLAVPGNVELLDRLRSAAGAGLRLHNTSRAFVEDYLLAMRRRGAAPDPALVLKNLKESIAFRPISDTTAFVRQHILEADDIDVAGLKGSMEVYRALEAEVQDRERQLEQVRVIRGRLQTWARQAIGINTQSFVIAETEFRRLGQVVAERRAKRVEALAELAREQASKAHAEQAIAALTRDRAEQEAQLGRTPEGERLRMLDERAVVAGDEFHRTGDRIRRTLVRLGAFAKLSLIMDRVPMALHGSVAAARAAAEMAASSDMTLLARRAEIEAAERGAVQLLQARASFEAQLDAVEGDGGEVRRAIEDLRTRLEGGNEGAPLSPDVQEFIRDLRAAGIKPIALPEVVEIAEPAWALALEMLLGPNTEAIIVPAHQVRDAHGIMHAKRERLSRCRVVDVRKTHKARRNLPARSIAEVATSSNSDALAFIRHTVGGYVRVEAEAELEHQDYAITKQGKTATGMALRVFKDRTLILGRTAQEAARAEMRSKLDAALDRCARLDGARRALQGALAAIDAVEAEGRDAAAQALTHLFDQDAAVRSLSKSRELAGDPQARAIRAEIAQIEEETRLRKEELKDLIEPSIARLGGIERKLELDVLRDEEAAGTRCLQRDEAVEREREELADLMAHVSDAESIATAKKRIGVAVDLDHTGRGATAVLADMRTAAERALEALKANVNENRRRGANAYHEFVRLQPPLSDPTETMMLAWTIERERTLEHDELRRSRAQLEEARREMEAALKEGLLNRLAEKTAKVRRQISRINGQLAERRFTGQLYEFTWSQSLQFRPLHALARAVAESPDRSLDELTGSNGDPACRTALVQLEALLEREDAANVLRDYREHFDFDLRMTAVNGQVTTLSKRAVTGSGGQKQAPYYVAVAAAMAAAYYPRSAAGAEAEGMGLVVFDEAFNNLDTPNTSALMDYFASLGLQVIVAAPDKVRSTFLEIVETIVTVRRDPSTEEPVLAVSHIGERARREVAAINPLHMGIAAFRDVPAQAAE